MDSILARSWAALDQLVVKHPGARVSGGIFLYERQASVLSALIRRLVHINSGEQVTVCETGFGAGHSAALFLASHESVQVVSFDLFNRPYQLRAVELLQKRHRGRLTPILGDSCTTVPRFTGRCDLLHGSSLCRSDNIDLVARTSCGTILTSTAMDSLVDRAVYFGPRAQWRQLLTRGCINKTVCYTEESRALARDYNFRKARQGNISHKWCVAVTTGKCSSAAGREAACHQQSSMAGLLDLCPQARIKIPD